MISERESKIAERAASAPVALDLRVIIEGKTLPLDRANLDTDQIVPARHLTGITTTGLGKYLFEDMPGGPESLAAHAGANIIVTRENFGCGSSREHAAWAIIDRGFKAVIAPSFARIFHENAYNNALTPVILTAEEVEKCMHAVTIKIDVEKQTVTLDNGERFTFDLDPLRKQFILGGGFLEYMNARVAQVRAWESTRPHLSS